VNRCEVSKGHVIGIVDRWVKMFRALYRTEREFAAEMSKRPCTV